MENIYQNIATRTGGDIYVGVVGPVRVGKSSFITRFVEEFVLPKIVNQNAKACAIDELPQSADGKAIMTTQPKFVPAESVLVEVGGVKLNMRLVDCVGYFTKGAEGALLQDGKPRMVKTPWSTEKMPLEKAAEIGTQKVVADHSTVAILVTSDASFGEFETQDFAEAETRLVRELKALSKPFVIVLNSKEPTSQKALSRAKELEKTHGVPVVTLSAQTMTEQDITHVFEKMLLQFPVQSIEVQMPNWLTALPFSNPIVQEVVLAVKNLHANTQKIGQLETANLFETSENFEKEVGVSVLMDQGKIALQIVPKQNLFFKVLSEQCGLEILDDFDLVKKMKDFANAKLEFSKLEKALESVKETGYGIVAPTIEDFVLDEPEVQKQGMGKFGVKLKATAPSLHIMRVDLETEISPMVGTEEQSKDLVTYLTESSKANPKGILQASLFGKSVESLMCESLSKKLDSMPVEAQKKMRKTLSRIVNEGKGGIICILL